MTVAGIPFTEEVIPLDQPGTKENLKRQSGAGRVPVLHHGELTVWESLGIIEYLAETFSDPRLWPEERPARAMARAVSNEMHAGFQALRKACPMNMSRPISSARTSNDLRQNSRILPNLQFLRRSPGTRTGRRV